MGRLIKRGAAPQTEFIPYEVVEQAIIDAGHGELLRSRFVHRDWSDIHKGYGHQVAGRGVEHPKLYAAEVHMFINEAKNPTSVSVVAAFRLTDIGELSGEPPDVQLFAERDVLCARRVTRLYSLLDGTMVQFGFKTFESAVFAAKTCVERRRGKG